MVNTRQAPGGLRPTPRNEAITQVARLGTILGVWAHPDDEAYLATGIMRLALENGQRVVCVTATAGERGTEEPHRWPPEVLGPTRRRELSASFVALASGLDNHIEHHWLDHHDGHCAHIDAEIGADQIGNHVDHVRPDTLLTFDPNGLTGHPDHQAVAKWTALALDGRTDIAHLETVVARSWLEHFDDSVDITSYFDQGYPQAVDDRDIELNLVLDDRLWSIKDRALRAHATQTRPVIDHLGPDLWRAFSITESFTTHRPPPPGADTNGTDQ
jgi:LmbE family N-acetylglucosaminyl deacetylase